MHIFKNICQRQRRLVFGRLEKFSFRDAKKWIPIDRDCREQLKNKTLKATGSVCGKLCRFKLNFDLIKQFKKRTPRKDTAFAHTKNLHKLQHISKLLFSNYLSSVREVRAEANSDSSHSHSRCRSDEENDDIDEVVICENDDF
uniref:Uncharacterized protein n=1 Tax=Romanomermis culicivorax TaxID=13658 RepID=A0A915IA27_ROMCU